jgi:hypothetical protein
MEAQNQERLTYNGRPVDNPEILGDGEFETVKEWLRCAMEVVRADDAFHIPEEKHFFFFGTLMNYCVDRRAPMNSALQNALYQRYFRLRTRISEKGYDRADREALKTANLINDHLIYSRLDED